MKNFSLFGIADKISFGLNGLIIKNNGTVFQIRNSADTGFAEIHAKAPTTDDALVTLKYYNDNMASGSSPVTTNGDLITGDNLGVDSRLPVGSNNFILIPDSTIAGGLKWMSLATHPTIISINSNISTNSGDITTIENDILGINLVLSNHEGRISTLETFSSVVSVKGDLLTFTTVKAKLPIGINTQVLTVDLAQPTGMKWATPVASGGGGNQTIFYGTQGNALPPFYYTHLYDNTNTASYKLLNFFTDIPKIGSFNVSGGDNVITLPSYGVYKVEYSYDLASGPAYDINEGFRIKGVNISIGENSYRVANVNLSSLASQKNETNFKLEWTFSLSIGSLDLYMERDFTADTQHQRPVFIVTKLG